ncbi:hypothetical protein B0H13DRAFT_1892115 [Mycena leptocephala]|nr:hypothetical protein B0H13DRAFT_1892115 [Mycena leptocephala]
MPPVSVLLVVPTLSSSLFSKAVSRRMTRPAVSSRVNWWQELGAERVLPTFSTQTMRSPAKNNKSNERTYEKKEEPKLPPPRCPVLSRAVSDLCEDRDAGHERPGDVAHIRRADERALALHTAELKTSTGLKWGENLSSIYM